MIRVCFFPFFLRVPPGFRITGPNASKMKASQPDIQLERNRGRTGDPYLRNITWVLRISVWEEIESESEGSNGG